MVGLKARGAVLTVMMLTIETMMASMMVTTSSTLGFPGENHEAFPICLITKCLANAELDAGGTSLQEHESQFFRGAHRAQGPG